MGGAENSEPVTPSPLPTAPASDETLLGCLSMIGGGSELTAFPFLLGVLGCGFAGYSLGAERFPDTGAEYVLAVLGGFLGIFVGIALAGAAVGALLGWAVGWGLWFSGKRVLGIESEQAFWWPIYFAAGAGGLVGLVWAVYSGVNTVRWTQRRGSRRPTA